MAFCVCAMSLSTVSCGKLEDDINTLKGQVESLTLKLAELESKLNTEVTNLNAAIAAIEAKVAVIKVEEKDGSVVLTLANGNTLNVAKADGNVSNTGLVTTVTKNGKTYWAVVKNDGTVESLNVEVGHPDVKISFKVDAETKALLISYDGKTYESTGVVVKDPEAYKHIITNFQEGDDYVVFTIGDKQYKLPKYDGNAALGLSRGNFFLRYEGSKKIELTAEGIDEYYVMAKPNGWKATFNETTLTVTAPTRAAVEIGAAETEGEILVHATTADGRCKVAKVDVKAGPGLTIKIETDGTLVIENSYSGEITSMWGDVSFGFKDFVLGLATPEDFNADPAKYIETYNTTWSAPNYSDIIYPSGYNVLWGGEYVEGEYETDVLTSTVNEVYYSYMWENLPAGAHYVVWVAPVEGEGQAVIEDAVWVEYVNLLHEVEVASVSHSDATLSITVAGASSYIVGCVAESYYNSEYNPMSFEDYMNSAMGGPWAAFTKYGAPEALGTVIPAEGLPEELNISEILHEKLAFGENYKVWVMPIVDHLAKYDAANSYPEEDYYVYDYSAFDFNANFLPYVMDFTTNDIVAGGAYEAELELQKNDLKNIYVNVTPSEGTEVVYYGWYDVADYVQFSSDAEVMAALIEDCYSPLLGAETVSKTYVSPGTKWVLATFSVGADGKYGKIVAQTFSTQELPFDENVTVELVSCTESEDGKNFIVSLNVTGATKVMGYNIKASDSALNSFLETVCLNGHKTSYYGYEMATVTDGKAVLTFAKNTYKTNYYVAAYNVANNAVSSISATTVSVPLTF